MNPAFAVFKREVRGYFTTPVAYVFITIFLALSGTMTFFVGNFFDRGQADLQPFFTFHPWLYILLVPAITMRLWAEERKTGTLESLLTLPVTLRQAVLGKFFAAWAFGGLTLLLTFPLWFTVNYLGNPDNGVILAGYIGSLLMLGAYLAIGAALSALTNNQVIAYIMTAAVCFLFTVAGTPMMLDFFAGWLPGPLGQVIGELSFLTRFQAITLGVIDVRDLFFFGATIALFLYINTAALDLFKGE